MKFAQSIAAHIRKAFLAAAKKIFRKSTFVAFVKHVLPVLVLAFVIAALIIRSGLDTLLAENVAPIPGIAIFLLCFIPAISPVIGPGLGIVLIAGILTAEQIAAGSVHLVMALPALLAIDAQIGGDFVPAGLALGEEEPETINAGVPPVLFTRLITVPVAVVAAYFFCFGFN